MALPPLTEDPVWAKLVQYYNTGKQNLDIRTLFEKDANRFNKFR